MNANVERTTKVIACRTDFGLYLQSLLHTNNVHRLQSKCISFHVYEENFCPLASNYSATKRRKHFSWPRRLNELWSTLVSAAAACNMSWLRIEFEAQYSSHPFIYTGIRVTVNIIPKPSHVVLACSHCCSNAKALIKSSFRCRVHEEKRGQVTSE